MFSNSAVLRQSRLRNVILAAFLAFSMVAAVSAFADHGGVPPAHYSASVTPGTCEAVSSCSLTFTVTNQSPPNSGSLMDTATITVPTGFSDTSAGPVTVASLTPKSWSADADTADGTVTVTLTAGNAVSGLAPTESVSVTINTTPSLATVGPGNTFDTTASGTFPLVGETAFDNTQPADPTVTVVNEQVNCPSLQGCETDTVTLNNTSASAAASTGGTNETLTLSVGGTFAASLRICADSARFTAVGEAVTTNVTGTDRSHTVTITLPKTVNNSPGAPGAERIDICAAADGPFVTKDGTPAVQDADTGLYEGLIPNCPALPVTKCVVSRTRQAGSTVIRIFVEPGDPIEIPVKDVLA